MSISMSRLFGPYNPVADFQAREQILVLGEIGQDPDLQAEIIQSNLEQTWPTVSTLGDIEWVERPFSKWEIYKIAKADRIVIASTIATVITLALGIIFWKYSITSIMNYYRKYSEGRIINFYYNGILACTRPLRFSEVIAWGVEVTIMNLAYAALCLVPIVSVVKAIKSAIYSEPKTQVAIRSVLKAPSSGAFLSHEVEDTFTKSPLFLSKAREPKKLTIGSHTGDFWKMINCVLSKPLYREPQKRYGQMAHPFEDRAFTTEELEKFENDIKNILTISDLAFLHQAEPADRKRAFLFLLPQLIIDKYHLSQLFNPM